MDEVEYGVFWKTDYNNNWKRYYAWSPLYEDAYYYFKDALDNPRCRAAKIVEKDITYLDVEVMEKNNDEPRKNQKHDCARDG